MLHSHTINSEWKKFKNGTKIKQLHLKVSEHIWCGIPVLMKMCLIKMRFKFKSQMTMDGKSKSFIWVRKMQSNAKEWKLMNHWN